MFALSDTEIDFSQEKQRLHRADCGGFVSFEGWVRNHNNQESVTHLIYHAYAELALNQGNAIIQQALQQFDIRAASCIHRTGPLQIGDMAIWIGVAAAHRKAAFEACQFILDTVKADVPIWKEEFYPGQAQPRWLSNNG